MKKPNTLCTTPTVTGSNRLFKECPYLVQLGDDLDPFFSKIDADPNTLYNLEDKDECQKRSFS